MTRIAIPQDRVPSRSTQFTVLLALVVAATVGLRIELIANKATISHDEAITYLSATCHQGEYGQYLFDGQPKPASTWKSMLRADDRYCFGQIGSDLGQHDIHPPLYFWLLHVWSLAVGVEVWTGPALNSIIAVFSTLLLYRFARSVLQNGAEEILVTFTFALNLAVTSVSGLARQYDLLILITLLISWTTVAFAVSSKSRLRFLLAFATLSVLGGLTHYHFIMPWSACVIYLVWKLRFSNIRALALAVASLAAGYLSSFVLHPYFLSSVDKELGFFGALTINAESLLFRFIKLSASFASYYYLIVLLILIAFWFLVQHRRAPGTANALLRQVDWSGVNVLFFAIWIGGGIILLYLSSITPLHQMSAKYFAMAWPFFSFVPVYILRLTRQRPSVKFYLYLFPLVLSIAVPLQRIVDSGASPGPQDLLGDTNVILVDNTARGIFPRIVWHIPDQSTVIAAAQSDLIDQPSDWLDGLDEAFVYVSEVSYGSTSEGQARIIDLLEGNGYVVTERAGVIADAGTVFEVQRSTLDR